MAKQLLHKNTKPERSIVSNGDFSAREDMQNPNRVFISMAKTINLGNYEALRVEYGQGCSIQPGQTVEDAKKGLTEEVVNSLAEIIGIARQSFE